MLHIVYQEISQKDTAEEILKENIPPDYVGRDKSSLTAKRD